MVPARSNDWWLAALRSTGACNQEACEALRALLLRGLRRALGDRGVDSSTLEDFAQEGLVRVLGSLDGFRGDSGFVTWAMAVALRVAFTELRRARWKDRSLEQMGVDRWLPDPSPGADDDLERRSLVATMQRIIRDRLTPRQRVSILAKLEGVPQVTLADALATNPNALYKLQHDARRRLREGILASGFTEADVRRILDLASGD